MQFFGKTMKNVRKHSDCKPATTEGKRNYLVSEPNYYKINIFFRKILMNKPAYWGLSVLEISKIVMFEFWHDYVKQKHGEKVKQCCMNTDSFMAYIIIEDIYVHISKDIETRFDPSNWELSR